MVVLREVDTKEVLEADMDMVSTKDMEEGEVGPRLVLVVEILVMCQYFVPNRVLSMGTTIDPNMSQRIFPT